MQTKQQIQGDATFLSPQNNKYSKHIYSIYLNEHTHQYSILNSSINFQNHLPITGHPHHITSLASLEVYVCTGVPKRSLWHNFWFYLYAFDFDLFTLPTVHAHLHSQFAKCGTCDRINRNMLSIFIFDLGFSPSLLLTPSLCMFIFLNLFHLFASKWCLLCERDTASDKAEKTKQEKKPGLLCHCIFIGLSLSPALLVVANEGKIMSAVDSITNHFS